MKSLNLAYPPPPNPPARELSPYDRLVLDQVRQGRSSRQIAGKRKNIKAGIKKVDRIVDKLARRFCCVSRHGLVRRLRQENPVLQIPDAKSDVKFTKAEDLIIRFVAQGFTDRKIVEILSRQEDPYRYFSDARLWGVPCTGLADCLCGGSVWIDPGAGPGRKRRHVHDGAVKDDYGRPSTVASTEGVIENYLGRIYRKLGWSRSAGRVNRIKLALFYEDRLYASLSETGRQARQERSIKMWKDMDQSKDYMRWLRETEAIRENGATARAAGLATDRQYMKRVLLRVFDSPAPSAEDQVNKMDSLRLLVELHRTIARQERYLKIRECVDRQENYMQWRQETEALRGILISMGMVNSEACPDFADLTDLKDIVAGMRLDKAWKVHNEQLRDHRDQRDQRQKLKQKYAGMTEAEKDGVLREFAAQEKIWQDSQFAPRAA